MKSDVCLIKTEISKDFTYKFATGHKKMSLKVSRSGNIKTESIWNINFFQNTNEQHYPEQLYRLGMFTAKCIRDRSIFSFK